MERMPIKRRILAGFLLYIVSAYAFMPQRTVYLVLLAVIMERMAYENYAGAQGHTTSWKSVVLLLGIGILFHERDMAQYALSFVGGVSCATLLLFCKGKGMWKQYPCIAIYTGGFFLVLFYYLLVLPLPSIPAWLTALDRDMARLFLDLIGAACLCALLMHPLSSRRLQEEEWKMILCVGAFWGLCGEAFGFASCLAGGLLAALKNRLCRS